MDLLLEIQETKASSPFDFTSLFYQVATKYRTVFVTWTVHPHSHDNRVFLDF